MAQYIFETVHHFLLLIIRCNLHYTISWNCITFFILFLARKKNVRNEMTRCDIPKHGSTTRQKNVVCFLFSSFRKECVAEPYFYYYEKCFTSSMCIMHVNSEQQSHRKKELRQNRSRPGPGLSIWKVLGFLYFYFSLLSSVFVLKNLQQSQVACISAGTIECENVILSPRERRKSVGKGFYNCFDCFCFTQPKTGFHNKQFTSQVQLISHLKLK